MLLNDGSISPVYSGEESISNKSQRPKVKGKFLWLGNKKFWVRGVSYGAFSPDSNGQEYQDREIIQQDFAQMAASGFNTVRIPHTTPPRFLLDIAWQHGLRVMVGLSAEQYVGYLIDKKKPQDVEGLIRAKVKTCVGHPALLCYALGNEIPASILRWLGRRQVEAYLERLYWAVKVEDPDSIVTYVNYPTTEYLQLPFLDLVSFNVYLESQEGLAAYLHRLQNIAGDRPLLMSEVGLDGLRNGEERQAETLRWQIQTTFAAGCLGAVVFSWTDEWYRGGAEVDDWAFGLTRKDRSPKPALLGVSKAFEDIPFPENTNWPKISVIMCCYNEERTIREGLEGLKHLQYPKYEVIVVDDGSTDLTAPIAKEYEVQLISTPNRGLSSARNTGLEAATGEIVAYIDGDAYPDPHWLTYLAMTFSSTSHAGVGGPNLPPLGDQWIADCVANAPGRPQHVLLTDCEAEHIPGCNMAFRKESLETIGGFDPQFRNAGDDVDICWRLQEKGWTLGYHPAAKVWHHCRNSITAYWKQQLGYGKAEALLEKKWPDKYNAVGHTAWGGRIYGKGLTESLTWAHRIYHGTWGSAPFQSLYSGSPIGLFSLTTLPEWYLVSTVLAGISLLGLLWPPLLWTVPVLALALFLPIIQVCLGTVKANFPTQSPSFSYNLKRRILTAILHMIQPLARLFGRLGSGLSPWRVRSSGFSSPWPKCKSVWSEDWKDPNTRLYLLYDAIRKDGAAVTHGGDFDRWDLEVRGGIFSTARLLMATEDHGSGSQFIRLWWWPKFYPGGVALAFLLLLLSISAGADQAWAVCGIFGTGTFLVVLRMFMESAKAIGTIKTAIKQTIPSDTK